MKLLPPEPTYEMLRALAGDPPLLAASDEAELRKRYKAMRDSAPEYVNGEAITKARDEAFEDAARIALSRTEIPRDAKKPTRDQVVVVGEEIAAFIRARKSISHGEGQRK